MICGRRMNDQKRIVSFSLRGFLLAIGIIGGVGLGSLMIKQTPSGDPSQQPVPPDSLRAYMLSTSDRQLLSKWQDLLVAGRTDSMLSWAQQYYRPLQYIGLRLSERATLAYNLGNHIVAAAQLDSARALGQLLAGAVQDSFLLKQVDWIEKLDRKKLRIRAEASYAYAHAYELLIAGDAGAARKEFEHAHRCAESIQDSKLTIDAIVWLQWLLARNNEYAAVIELAQQIDKQAAQADYKQRIVDVLLQSAVAYRELDLDSLALVNVARVIQMASSLSDSRNVARGYCCQTMIFYRMGKYASAENALQNLMLVDREGRYSGWINLIQGLIFSERGEYGLAQSAYEKALESFRQPGVADRLDESSALTNLSLLQFENGDYENALASEKKSFEINRAEKNEVRMAFSLSNMGLIYSAMDSLTAAEECYQSALQLLPGGGKRHLTDIWLRLGDLLLKKGALRAAHDAFRRAETLSQSAEYHLGNAGALSGLARVELKRTNIDQARSYFSSVLEIAQHTTLPRVTAATLFGLYLVEKEAHNFEEAAQLIEQAIEASEGLRTSIHRDSLRVSFFTTAQELFDEAILLSLARGQKDLALHYAERGRARALLDAIGGPKSLTKNDPMTRLDFPISSLDEWRRKIPASVQVIEYRLVHGTLLIWLVDKNNMIFRQVPIVDNKLELLIQQFLESIGAENFEAFRTHAERDAQTLYQENCRLGKQLYQILWEPIAKDLIPGMQLVIIPDGYLHRLPFGALVTAEDLFFDEKYVWTKAPSLTILTDGASQNRTAPLSEIKRFLMVSNPTGDLFCDRSVARLFAPSQIVAGQKARFDTLKESLINGAEIVYFCVHAVSDSRHPMNSYIELAGDHDQTVPVYARQLLELDFSLTRLAVLNACETANGKIARGEGALNMVRVFSMAGVPSVIASLWKNDNRRSVQILGDFFRNLAQGRNLAVALQQAKLQNIEQLKREVGFPLPYFWSALEIHINNWAVDFSSQSI
jgi:tetratricopeptide (TPR) repeat protein